MADQSSQPVILPNKAPTLRVVPMPADVNQNGDVFGGWIMAQVDIAGAMVAMRRARGRVATVSVDSFTFKQPVSVGDIVSFYRESSPREGPRSRSMWRSMPNVTRHIP